ncbi:MAG: ARMT1-like domain-containing protein [Eubacteriales bacterium]|nr:ARMT1-like domain-containing protein [Eubacteriales bacterium]
MSFAMDDQCLLCYLRRNLDLVRPLGSTEKTMEFARALMALVLKGPREAASPYFNPQVADLLHEMYGLDLDRFRQEKLDSNRFVMARLEQIRQKIAAAPDPVLAGLQFAILGNYLDFSALQGQVSFEKLEEMLEKALEMPLDIGTFRSLTRDLKQGRRLLYLTDNAGEIGFDRLFAEAIAGAYPQLDITFCVRGAIAQNDATREDAAQVGLPFPIIDNGNRIPGTQLDRLSREAREALDAADVIIAKGMANVETMFGCGKNVYYAFLIKCPRFEQKFHAPLFTPMLVKDGELQ